MKRTLFFLGTLIFLLNLPVWSQETEPETVAPQSAEAADDSDADSQPKRPKREKIKALYDEYWEKSDEVHENQRISGFQFVGDFITDKLPLTLDLGAEPGEHGSTIFGVLQYDWTPIRASRVLVEYQSLKTSTDATDQFSVEDNDEQIENNDWVSISKSKQIEIDFYPYMRYFGDESRFAKTPFIYFGLGAFYLYNWYNITYSGWVETSSKRILSNIGLDGYYHQFGPIAIGAIKMPFFKYFGLALETTFSPINRVISGVDTVSTRYSFDIDKSESSSTVTKSSDEASQWCSPLLKIDLAVDVFTYFRFRTRFDFRRIYLGSLKEVNLIGTFNTDENRAETYKWRYGMEIVFPSSNRTRKKNSHLWAGLYYEHQWDVTTTDGNSITAHTGKWIFCFGT